jgi:hyperosmotically inducible protein
MRDHRYIAVSALAVAALLAAGHSASAQTTGEKIEQKMDRAGDKMNRSMDRAGDKIEQKTDRAEGKMERAGDTTKDMAKDAKTGVSDSWLTAKAKIALFADERVKGRQVNVETNNGVVALRGKVDSAEAKSAAESIAKGVDGVRSVKNELQVVAPTDRAVVDAKDEDLKKAVEDRFSKDPRLSKIDVRADSGTVTLTGDADGIGTSARASEVARSVPGVRAVRNDLTVKEGRDTMRSERRDLRADRPTASDGSAFTSNRNEHVRLMQQALKKEGYDPGPIDGVQGPQTTAAIEAFQKAENLPVTGRANAETLGKLRISSDAGSSSRPSSR